MRLIAWLLLAAVLILIGAYPSLAVSVGQLLAATVGLALSGAVALLAQPAVQLALAAVGAVYLYRNRRTA